MSCYSITRSLLAVAIALATPSITEAATFAVTNTNDSGTGSLRQALLDANAAASGQHSVLFGPTFPTNGVITLQSPLPTWTNGHLSIEGNGRSPIVSGAGVHPVFIAGVATTRLDLEGIVVRDGRRASGGCVALQLANTAATLTLTNTRFSNCRALANGAPRGGAVDWLAGAGVFVSVVNSEFDNNRTVAPAAPPIIAGGSGGALSLQSTLIYVDASRFEENLVDVEGQSSGGTGGAIAATVLANGSARIVDSVFRANSATPLTNDSFGLGGGAAIFCTGPCTWTIERSYFRGNTARAGGALFGPGTFGGSANAKRIRIVNSSFVNNDVLGSGGALSSRGGRLELEYSSFFGNGAASAAHIDLSDSEDVRVIHNVLAATSAGAPPCAASNVSVAAAFGSISRAPCNLGALIPVTTVAQLPNPVVDESQAIGVLRFDGVPEVVDAVPAADNTTCPGEDARNQSRPIDGDSDGVARCDRGAFEHPSELLLRSGFES